MSKRDPAAPRWAIMQVVRLAGVAMVLIGVLHQAGRFPPFAGLPAAIGYAFIAVGLVEVFYLPLLLARRWKSPPRPGDPVDGE